MGDEQDIVNPPPLLLDAMLGRLARWLRLMGFDATYLPDVDDLVLVRHARAEGRLLITRDRGLAARRGVETLLLDSQDLEGQLEEVLTALGPPSTDAPPRCTVCNEPLEDLPRSAAKGRVPPYVLRTQQAFAQCPVCRRVYWPGTHWEAIQQRMEHWRKQRH